MTTPKEQLEGLTLQDGWSVRQRVHKGQADTGGNFSAGYIVESPSGQRCFLKAIDFSAALTASDPARALQLLTEAFNFERDTLNLAKRFSCVVTAITDGKVAVGTPSTSIVQYLILELAEDNLRRMAVPSLRLPMSLALRALHNVANGLRQLHQEQIAHQDMKPSNVLKFEGNQFKVTDLGRAAHKGRTAPHDQLPIAGDKSYAPPELLYGQIDPEFVVRRFGADAYLLGSLATFLVTGSSMTSLVISELHESAHPGRWQGTYAQVLPQVRQAYARAMSRVAQEISADAPYREELLLCIQQLCEPDPSLRGHPRTRAIASGSGNPYNLERYVSIFDGLGFKARLYEQRQSAK